MCTSPAIAQLNKSGFPLIIDIFTQVFKVFYLVFSVLGIELTLVWNHISGIYTVGSIGQLIPFVIGLGGLIQVCYDIWKEVRIFSLCFSTYMLIVLAHIEKESQSRCYW